VKMALDSPIKSKATTNLQPLVDVEVMLSLWCIIPLFEGPSNSANYMIYLCVILSNKRLHTNRSHVCHFLDYF
jgi:hypothetical protein